MDKKKRKKIRNILVVIIRLFFFIFFPAIFSTAFAGVKSLCQQISAGEILVMNPFILQLIGVCLVTMVCGRIFCGFACAFGTYGDFVYWCSTKVRKKMKKKPLRMAESVTKNARTLKYKILVVLLIFCWIGRADLISANSPWTVFSQLQTGRLSALSFSMGTLLLVLITVGMAWEPRFFCRFLCPMGAVFALLPVMPWATVRRDREQCLRGCKACRNVCPAGIEIDDVKTGDTGGMGECFACGKCANICPKGNIKRI